MLNKKIAAVTAALLVATAGTANAGAFDSTKFNLGAEVSLLNKPSYNSSLTNLKKKTKLGANVFVGARFNENVGAELGFGFVQKTTLISSPKLTNKVNNFYADVLGYVPVASKVSLIGSLGVGFNKSKLSAVPAGYVVSSTAQKRKLAARIGAGAQYDFCENWAARAMVRYQKNSKKALQRSNTSLAVGAVYTF